MDAVFLVWLVHAAVGATLSAPILWVGRKRIMWTRWELLALAVPFCVWLVLMLSPLADGRKSFANVGEPIYISFAMPLAAVFQIVVGKSLGRVTLTLLVVGLLSGVAAATFFLVPIKPIR